MLLSNEFEPWFGLAAVLVPAAFVALLKRFVFDPHDKRVQERFVLQLACFPLVAARKLIYPPACCEQSVLRTAPRLPNKRRAPLPMCKR